MRGDRPRRTVLAHVLDRADDLRADERDERERRPSWRRPRRTRRRGSPRCPQKMPATTTGYETTWTTQETRSPTGPRPSTRQTFQARSQRRCCTTQQNADQRPRRRAGAMIHGTAVVEVTPLVGRVQREQGEDHRRRRQERPDGHEHRVALRPRHQDVASSCALPPFATAVRIGAAPRPVAGPLAWRACRAACGSAQRRRTRSPADGVDALLDAGRGGRPLAPAQRGRRCWPSGTRNDPTPATSSPSTDDDARGLRPARPPTGPARWSWTPRPAAAGRRAPAGRPRSSTRPRDRGLRLRVWALGDSPAAHALAARTGLVAARDPADHAATAGRPARAGRPRRVRDRDVPGRGRTSRPGCGSTPGPSPTTPSRGRSTPRTWPSGCTSRGSTPAGFFLARARRQHHRTGFPAR